MNREAWLQEAVSSLRPVFLGAGYTIPDLQVSVGWPSSGGLARKRKTIGECWFGTMSADGKPHIFISPLLDEVIEPTGVLATLVHEICHVAAGPDAKHGLQFVKVMKKLGLEGKPTSTVAGADLLERFKQMAASFGEFPHARISPKKSPATQTTRMHKCECAACGYVARVSKKWLDFGPPGCAVQEHGPMKLILPEKAND